MKKLITALLTAMLLMASSANAAGTMADAGKAYEKGNYTQVIKILKPLALKGDQVAQYNLGYMYYEGQGVAQNYAEAIKWYKLAAAQPYAEAQYNLGVMYHIGQGVAQDYVIAHMWFNLAKADKSRDIVASKMTPQQIAEAQKLARECEAREYEGC